MFILRETRGCERLNPTQSQPNVKKGSLGVTGSLNNKFSFLLLDKCMLSRRREGSKEMIHLIFVTKGEEREALTANNATHVDCLFGAPAPPHCFLLCHCRGLSVTTSDKLRQESVTLGLVLDTVVANGGETIRTAQHRI